MLTVLGIGIGIGVIFFLVSLGYGFQKLILDRIATSDSLLTLDVIQENETVKLDKKSLEEIRNIGNISEISPVIAQDSQINRSGFISDLRLNIVDNSYLKLEGISIEEGNTLKDNDQDGVVLSSAVLELLNLSKEDIGKTEVSLKVFKEQKEKDLYPEFVDKKYTLRGIIEDELQLYAYVDKASVQDMTFNQYDKIKIKVTADDKLEGVREEIINKGYYVSAISDLVDQAKQIFNVSQIILALFGVVALIVSAIGMFNTMTITLLERTQEIGIMKTLGASSYVVWKMFLVESILIGFSGGVMGLLLGYLGSWGTNSAVNMLARSFGGIEVNLFYIPGWFVIFILSFSVLVGAVTGFYPARRAAKLNSLKALRYK